jgi:hypothetical protein
VQQIAIRHHETTLKPECGGCREYFFNRSAA